VPILPHFSYSIPYSWCPSLPTSPAQSLFPSAHPTPLLSPIPAQFPPNLLFLVPIPPPLLLLNPLFLVPTSFTHSCSIPAQSFIPSANPHLIPAQSLSPLLVSPIPAQSLTSFPLNLVPIPAPQSPAFVGTELLSLHVVLAKPSYQASSRTTL
jgi:hypothetical protein